MKGQSQVWADIVWFSGTVPRYSFILWLAVQNRLSTQDKLISYGIIQATHCVFCRDIVETHNHLFFDCPFTERLWCSLKGKVNVQWPRLDWPDLVNWYAANMKGKTFSKMIGK